MKKHGIDIDECCYEEMSKSVGGQSMPSEYWDEPFRNNYEDSRKNFYGDHGFDWSDMKGEK